MSKKGARKSAKGVVRKKGKKNRKHGRNAKWCALYKLIGQQLKNKKRRLRRHLRRNPLDIQGRRAFIAIGGSEDSLR